MDIDENNSVIPKNNPELLDGGQVWKYRSEGGLGIAVIPQDTQTLTLLWKLLTHSYQRMKIIQVSTI